MSHAATTVGSDFCEFEFADFLWVGGSFRRIRFAAREGGRSPRGGTNAAGETELGA